MAYAVTMDVIIIKMDGHGLQRVICFAQLSNNNFKSLCTVATDELLCLKNAGTQISMFNVFHLKSAPLAIEKI